MDVVADIERIVGMMRRLGHTVEYVPGWQTRGSGPFSRIETRLDHHDAFPARTGHAGGLRTCTFGRPDLRNSLCMFYLASDGVTYVVAAGISWHAGAGTLTTNSRSSGIEARNDGVGEAWPKVQLDAYCDLDACAVIVWGVKVYDHKEHRPGKIDRTGIHPGQWRARVDARVPAIKKILAGEAPNPDPKEWDEMASKAEIKEVVEEVVGAFGMRLVDELKKAGATEAEQTRLAYVWAKAGAMKQPDEDPAVTHKRAIELDARLTQT